ncbi:MAG TPA: DUF4180 domain-containing protein [Candidatus Angelobacter sp.]
MTAEIIVSAGYRLLVAKAAGPPLGSYKDVLELIENALAHRATAIVVPVQRLEPEFFHLRSGLAGEFIQKIVNYGLKLAVIGDISEPTAESSAFRDFVSESNRSGSVFFLPDFDALVARLSARPSGSN